jgi:hypothetical protein
MYFSLNYYKFVTSVNKYNTLAAVCQPLGRISQKKHSALLFGKETLRRSRVPPHKKPDFHLNQPSGYCHQKL